MRRVALALSLAALGCTRPKAYFSEDPIPLELAGAGGGLLGYGTAAEVETPFPMLVDTGSPITAYSAGIPQTSATRGTVQLYSNDAAVGVVPRLRIDHVELFQTPFYPTGLDAPTPVSGVIGGDDLQHFVLEMRYQPSPTLTITNELVQSQCDISQRCATVLPFSIAGGHQLIDIGDDVFNYSASYVLLDGCVEPPLDPLEPGLNCASEHGCEDIAASCAGISDPSCQQRASDCEADAPRYLPAGIDVRFAVSTGFPGVAITASAYDRLRGTGSAATLLADPTAQHTLYLPDQPQGISVAMTRVGRPAMQTHDPKALGALSLVQPDGFFGPCASLARSRRLRRVRPESLSTVSTDEATCLRSPPKSQADAHDLLDELLLVCQKQASNGECNDKSQDAHTNAYVDLEGTVPVMIVPDTLSLIQSINADARPQSATVEAIIGTEVLKRLGTWIDYANGRVVMTCADESCRVFPRQGHGTDCAPPVGDEVFGGGSSRSVSGTGCAIGP